MAISIRTTGYFLSSAALILNVVVLVWGVTLLRAERQMGNGTGERPPDVTIRKDKRNTPLDIAMQQKVVARLKTEFGVTTKPKEPKPGDEFEVEIISEKKLTTLRDVVPLLGQLGTVTKFDATDCKELRDLTGLGSLRTLKVIDLQGCSRVEDLGDLKGLTGLESLNLQSCSELQGIEGLTGLPSLRTLSLSGCGKVTKLESLRSLAALTDLNLNWKDDLENADSLKGLPAVKSLSLYKCVNLKDTRCIFGNPFQPVAFPASLHCGWLQ